MTDLPEPSRAYAWSRISRDIEKPEKLTAEWQDVAADEWLLEITLKDGDENEVCLMLTEKQARELAKVIRAGP